MGDDDDDNDTYPLMFSDVLPVVQTERGGGGGFSSEMKQNVGKSLQQLEYMIQPLLHWHAKALLYWAPQFPLQELTVEKVEEELMVEEVEELIVEEEELALEEGQDLCLSSNLVFSFSSSLILCSKVSQSWPELLEPPGCPLRPGVTPCPPPEPGLKDWPPI